MYKLESIFSEYFKLYRFTQYAEEKFSISNEPIKSEYQIIRAIPKIQKEEYNTNHSEHQINQNHLNFLTH